MEHRQWLTGLMFAIFLTGPAAVVAGSALIPVPDRPPADDFSLLAIDGSRYQLSDYRGDYVLVNFWAGWCSPCIRELPSMQRTYTAMKDHDFEILAVHVGAGTADMETLLERFEISFPVLVDSELALGNWNVTDLPASFLLDPEGRVVYRATGAVDWDDPAQRELLRGLFNGANSAAYRSRLPTM